MNQPQTYPIVCFVIQHPEGKFLAHTETGVKLVDDLSDPTLQVFSSALAADVVLRRYMPNGYMRVTINGKLR